MGIIKTLPPVRELNRDYCANMVLDVYQHVAFELPTAYLCQKRIQ